MVRQSSCRGIKRHTLLVAVTMAALLYSALCRAAPMYQPAVPFGGYAKDRCGHYGARSVVTDRKQAEAIVTALLEDSNWEIETIAERPRYFRVHLKDSRTGQQQVVIIDKSTGRVRPIN